MHGDIIPACGDEPCRDLIAGTRGENDVTCCSLCGSQDTRVARSIEVEPLVREWERSFQIDVRGEFHGLSKFDLRGCGVCRLGYFAPRSLAGSAGLYAQLQKFAWYYLSRKWEHDVAVEDLRDCHKALEVGCGFGDFVARAREEGIEIEGIELNDSAVQHAERRGWPVCRRDLRELAAQSQGSYDAVCHFQVLEHLPNPGEFLAACCALLRPGGKLLLGLPNADSFLRYRFDVLDLPPHHMTRWTSRVLERLPRLFPLRLKRLQQEPLAEYHVDNYVDAYMSAATRGGKVRIPYLSSIRSLVVRSIRRTGLRRLLRGHTLYASYVRV